MLAVLWIFVLRSRLHRCEPSQSDQGAKAELESGSNWTMAKIGFGVSDTKAAKQLAGDEPTRAELDGAENVWELESRPISTATHRL